MEEVEAWFEVDNGSSGLLDELETRRVSFLLIDWRSLEVDFLRLLSLWRGPLEIDQWPSIGVWYISLEKWLLGRTYLLSSASSSSLSDEEVEDGFTTIASRSF